MTFMTRFERTSPFQELTTLRNRMNQLFGQMPAFPPEFDEESLSAGTWIPAVDILETKDSIVLKAELPGIRKEDLQIEMENGTLTIRGEKKYEKETEERNYRRVERAYGNFTRTFAVPANVAADKITANFVDGVLDVELPKLEIAKPKKITIGTPKAPEGKVKAA